MKFNLKQLRYYTFLSCLFLTLAVCGAEESDKQNGLSKNEDRRIAQEAFVYSYPMLFNYKTLYIRAIGPSSADYIGGFNRFKHYARVYTPADTDIVTPSNDTPYSWAILDLRAEPVVLSTPKLSKNRYVSFQLIDLYTHIFGYVGVRTTGYKAGNFLIVGPKWRGTRPKGIDKVFRSESEFAVILGRTGLNGSADLTALKALQKQYRLLTLSKFKKSPAPPAAPVVRWPIWDEKKALSPDFIGYTNFLLQFCEPHVGSETDLMKRFSKIGIGAGLPYDFSKLSPDKQQALAAGVSDGKLQIASAATHATSSLFLFGSRKELQNNYLNRAVGTAVGIYGNAKEEAVYMGTGVDGEGKFLRGSQPYTLSFKKDALPSAKFFWSLTLYALPNRQLAANPINRYSIGNHMQGLKYQPDGSLTLFIQHQYPGKDKATNWLPAPQGPYNLILRIYGPGPSVLNGKWKLPQPIAIYGTVNKIGASGAREDCAILQGVKEGVYPMGYITD